MWSSRLHSPTARCSEYQPPKAVLGARFLQRIAKIKAFVERLQLYTIDNLIQAFGDAVHTVTPENILKAVLGCGYEVKLQNLEVLENAEKLNVAYRHALAGR